MSARLRKKKLYRKVFNGIVFDQRLTDLMMSESAGGWRAIEPDVMNLFGNDRKAAWAWFITPAIALDGNRPVDLMANGNVQLVREHLIRLRYGVYT